MSNESKGILNLKHTLRAAWYSWEGLQHGVKSEQALKHVVIILAVLFALFLWFRQWPFLAMVLCWTLVLAFELLNAAVERVCDLVSLEHNLLIKRAKDLASAATAVAVSANVLLWLWVALTYFFH